MDNQERYDELDSFLSTLRLLKDELKSKDLIEELEYLLYNTNYENELNELQELLANEYEDVLTERKKIYRKIQGF